MPVRGLVATSDVQAIPSKPWMAVVDACSKTPQTSLDTRSRAGKARKMPTPTTITTPMRMRASEVEAVRGPSRDGPPPAKRSIYEMGARTRRLNYQHSSSLIPRKGRVCYRSSAIRRSTSRILQARSVYTPAQPLTLHPPALLRLSVRMTSPIRNYVQLKSCL